ncbi:MAG: CinA family nicotinamide mononucleotide deamidase-related protein [Phycisphaerales bacterium]|nr:CinA family nicotinamide mononucleotide deamidase-related protein [Phycisphaerales bacterium]
MIVASILNIGDELLIGQVVDTNSVYIAQQLNNIGVGIVEKMAVGDKLDVIIRGLTICSDQANVIIITGGLGPTSDDITKPALCNFFNTTLTTHQPTLLHLKHLFENVYKKIMPPINNNQALVPDCAEVLFNEIGTAPGLAFYKNEKYYFALPGVPEEMKYLMNNHVIPKIIKLSSHQKIHHKTLLTFGIGESSLATTLTDFEKELPHNISLAYLPELLSVRLRLTAQGTKANIENELEEQFKKIQLPIKKYIIATKDTTLVEVIQELLEQKNITVSIAESCTGGNVSALLTKRAGISKVFKGSIVCYHNELKKNLLGVSSAILETYGPVSKETVSIMAQEIRQRTHTDYGLAISGIMGPTGSTAQTLVGTVWIAISNAVQTDAYCHHLQFTRDKNIYISSLLAINHLREFILQ